MLDRTRLPPDTDVRVHGRRGLSTFPFAVVAARSPHKATSEALAAALTTFGAAVIYRGFYDDEPCDDHDVDHIAAFLNAHRGVAMLGFARSDDAAECARSLKGRRL